MELGYIDFCNFAYAEHKKLNDIEKNLSKSLFGISKYNGKLWFLIWNLYIFLIN